MALQLRDFQEKVRQDVYQQIRLGQRRILIVAATGAGKTIMAAQIVADAVNRGRTVGFVVHRDILIRQTVDKFSGWELNCGILAGGYEEHRDRPVQVISIQTLAVRNVNWFWQRCGLLILDECHLSAFASPIRTILENSPQLLVIGVTATPWRLSPKEGLGDWFSTMVRAPMPGELIDKGYLCKPVYYSLEKQQKVDCQSQDTLSRTVAQWKRLGFGRRTIAFASNVKSTRAIARAFEEHGIRAASVDGSMSPKHREKYYQQLETGQLTVLTSCEALAEGFDCPPVSCILLMRRTRSRAKLVQQIGRGLRLSPETEKTDCVILDCVGAISYFGFLEDIHEVGLERGRDPQSGKASLKVCPESDGGCGALVRGFELECPHCRYQFECVTVPPMDELTLMLPESDLPKFRQYRVWVRQAYRKGYSPVWAAHQFIDTYGGSYPPQSWRLGAVFGVHSTPSARQVYREYLERVARRGNKSRRWLERQMIMEFGQLGDRELTRVSVKRYIQDQDTPQPLTSTES
ncbi:MAG: DEAD/DEAH box helicase [Cyanobacteriota bacterium]|nr:DEAD/DEAH box helicase [Cyanobacteriota bacterium]